MLGITLTRQYSMHDFLEDIEFELHLHQKNRDTVAAINFMKSGIKMMFTGVEFTNKYAGSPLLLNDLTKNVCTDMSPYNQVLEKVYVQYWDSRQNDPLIELGLLLCSTIFMQHFTNKINSAVRIKPIHVRPTMQKSTSE